MDCLQVREAMSARMDGEPADLASALVEGHVQGCPECQLWQEAAHDITRRARLTGWSSPAELPDFAVLVGAHTATGQRTWLRRVRAGLLAAAAIGQLVLAILLLAGSADPMDMHGDHELGIFDVTLAVAFALGAFRPKLAAGLAWAAGTAALGLLVTATADVIDHNTFELHELQHLIAVAGALLLWWTARDERHLGPGGVRREPASESVSERTIQLRSNAA
jgi:predicted anti-sigma-YlaC factor YlaD